MVLQKIKTTSAWCEAKVGTTMIDLIIDTGASGCVATQHFLQTQGIKIQRKSNVSMTDINGHSKQPLGAIDDLPIVIDGIVIPTEVDVTEARTYAVVVGMDFLNKINAKIDIKKSLLTFDWDGQRGNVSIKYIHGQRTNFTDEDDKEESEEEDDSEDSEDEESEFEE